MIRLVIFLLFCSSQLTAQTIYTIGGTNPDFTTFNAAVDFLKNTTLTETVVFNVRDGVYEERVVIPEISGASEDNQIIFRGESGEAEQVRIETTISSNDIAERAVVSLDGADFVKFEFITLTHIGDANNGSAILYITNQAVSNRISNCIFISANNTSTTPYLIHADRNDDEAFTHTTTIENNLFQGGNVAALFFLWQGDIVIKNNRVEGNVSGGFRISACNNVTVANNEIETKNFGCSFIQNKGQIVINANRITTNSGIFLYENEGSAFATKTFVTNNYIKIPESGTLNGIYITRQQGTNIFNNTLSINATSTFPRAIYLEDCDYYDIKNNLFTHAQDVVLLESNSGFNFSLDYNNYYNGGNQVIRFYNKNYSLAQYQDFSNQSEHSTTINPIFDVNNPIMPRASELMEAGIFLAEVTTDILSNPRSNPPDLGAIEIEPYAIDLEVLDIEAPISPITTGNNNVALTVKNIGTDAITDIQIEWSINETAQPPIAWNGNLTAGSTTTISVGTLTASDLSCYNLTFHAILTQQTDEYPHNNSLQIENLCTALAGNYTVGTANDADFSTLTAALERIQIAGVAGAVELHLLTQIHDGPFHLMNFPGMGELNPLTISAASGERADAQLTSDGTLSKDYVFKLENVSDIHLKNFTISANIYQNNRFLIRLDGRCSRINIDGIEGHFTGGDYLDLSEIILLQDGVYDDITLQNSVLHHANSGMIMSNQSVSKDFRILNNHFYSTKWGIHLSFTENIQVIGNRANLTGEKLNYYNDVISLYEVKGNITVRKNQLFAIDGSALTIQGNSVRPNVEVSNNFFHYQGRGNRNRSGYGVAQITFANTVNYQHNTAIIEDSNVVGTVGVSIVNINNLNFNNNIVDNQLNGRAIKISLINGSHNIDFNSLHSANQFGIHNTDLINDFTQWQTTTTFDANSISVQPLFVSDKTYITYDTRLNNIGIKLPAITTDIENNPRHPQTPDLGAFEFTPPANDAGITKITTPELPITPGDHALTVTLRNYGTAPLQDVAIQLVVNETELPIYHWTGNLVTGDSTEVTLPAINLAEKIAYEFVAYPTSTNGMMDGQTYNDTARVEQLYTGLVGTYLVGEESADFSQLSAAIQALNRGGILGKTTFSLVDGVYNEPFELGKIIGADISYNFTLQSVSGDCAAVTLQRLSDVEHPVISLNETRFMEIKNIGFQIADHRLAKGIRLANGAGDILIRQNCFSTTGSQGIFILTGGDTQVFDEQIVVQENTFINGSKGVGFSTNYSANTSSDTGVRILNNRFTNQDVAISVSGFTGIQIKNNQIDSPDWGIDAGYLSNAKISGNTIFGGEELYRGIYLTGLRLGSLNHTSILNNYISFDLVGIRNATYDKIGIEINNAEDIKLFHNTIRVERGSEGRGINCLRIGTINSDIAVKNNLLYNNRDILIEISNDEVIEIDNNTYFHPTGRFGKIRYTDYSTLTDWQTATSYDQNSQFLHPNFTTPTGYQIENQQLRDATTTQLDPPVLQDVDGKDRSLVNPAAGCYEPLPLTNDLAVIEFIDLENGTSEGVQPVAIRIKNVGQQAINGLTVNWQVNQQVQTSVEYSAMLGVEEEIEILLGSVAFAPNTAYNIQATALPQLVMDDYLNDNTRLLENFYTRLHGSYTVGGDSPDFSDPQTALERLQRAGIDGAVTFLIRDGDYIVHATLDNYHGNQEYEVTIEAATGILNAVAFENELGEMASSGMVTLKDVHNLTFRNIIFDDARWYDDYVVQIEGNATNITFDGCYFFTTPFVLNSRLVMLKVKRTRHHTIDNLVINNTTFLGGFIGVDIQKELFYAGGVTNSQISNCFFTVQERHAIRADNAAHLTITNNRIATDASPHGGSYRGIYVRDSRQVSINRNKLNINRASSEGIFVERSSTNLTEPRDYQLTNNYVQLTGSPSTTGIFLRSLREAEVFHNTVAGSHNTSLRHDFTGENIAVRGNNFTNTGGGVLMLMGSVEGFSIDYNNYFNPAGITIVTGDGTFTDLTDWQTQSPQFNQHSISIAPLFLSDDSYEIAAAELQEVIPAARSVADDIIGNPRTTAFTDLGCYEVEPQNCDDITTDTDAPLMVVNLTGIGRQLNELQSYTLTEADLASILAGSSDNCTIFSDLTPQLSSTTFSCDDLGINAVSVTLTDLNGNESAPQLVRIVIRDSDENPCIEPLAIATPTLRLSAVDRTKVQLNWTVENANDFTHFIVQHSQDGGYFQDIATLATTTALPYSYIHQRPSSGNNYYRIQAIHSTQQSVFSAIQTIDLNNSLIRIFPNPVRSNLQIDFAPTAFPIGDLLLFDSYGKAIERFNLNGEKDLQQVITMHHLPAGVYYLQGVTMKGVFRKRVIKL